MIPPKQTNGRRRKAPGKTSLRGRPKVKKKLPKEKAVLNPLSKISDNPPAQNCSGYTFMTEQENREIEKKYQEGKMESQLNRNIWHTVKKKIKKQQLVEKITTSGPEWFQEMSPAQMKLVDNYETLLQMDLMEHHSGRTQKFLLDLGVWPEVAPNLVANSVKRSKGSVISFIFYIHQEVIAMEAPDYEKTFAEAKRLNLNISMFSINERILLTSVFHYHFPTLLEKLDKLLPPPYQEPNVLWGKEPPKKKKKKYSSPYLEPLPICNYRWKEELAEKRLKEKAIVKCQRAKERKEEMELLEMVDAMCELKTILRELKMKKYLANKTGCQKKSKSVESGNKVHHSAFNDEEIAYLTSDLPPRERKSFFFKKYNEHFKYYAENNDDDGFKNYPYLTRGLLDLEDEIRVIKAASMESPRSSSEEVVDEYHLESMVPLDISSKELNSVARSSNKTEEPESSSEGVVDEHNPKESMVPLDISYKELTSVTRSRITVEEPEDEAGNRLMSGPPLPHIKSTSLAIAMPPESEVPGKEHMMKKPYTVECTEPECAIVDDLDVPLQELELAKRRIATLPPKRQLKAAIKFLRDKGDPLAVLPNMEEVSYLRRWFEKRRGIKRTLNPRDKEELLMRSKNIWTAPYTRPTEAPMVKVPEGKFDWNQKNKIVNTANKRVYNHQRAIKHILIDNARDLFSSVFPEYASSRLTKSFRNTFYAYFPARERDCLVVRPWQQGKKS